MKHDFPRRCKPSLRMRFLILAVCAVSFAGVGRAQSMPAAPLPDDADGPLVCDDPVHDFGERDSVIAVKHTFRLRNTGDYSIPIERVITTCGCSAALLDAKAIAPGESVPLYVEVSLAGRRGFFRKHTYVITGGAEAQRLRLTVKGTIVQNVRVVPERLTLASVPGDIPTTATVLLESTTDSSTFQVKALEVGSRYLDARAETSEDGSQHTLHITTTPPIPVGVHSTVVEMLTDNPAYPRVVVPVSMTVVEKVRLVPEVLILDGGRADSEHTAMRFLNIMPGSVQEFRVTGVEAPLPEIEVEIVARPGSRYLLKFTHVPVDPLLDGQEVIILTDIPGMERLSVPFRFRGAALP